MSEWKEYKLKEICPIITDGSHFSPKEDSSGIPMFSVKDMRDNGFDYSKVKRISEIDYKALIKQGCQPEIGDILIAKDGSVLKHIFNVKEKPDYVLLSSIAIVKPDNKIVDSNFLSYQLKSPTTSETILTNFVSGSGVPRIVLKDFKEVEISLPPLPEQTAIAEVLSSLDDKIDLLHRQNNTLEQLAETLFRQWFVHRPELVEGEAEESWEVGTLGNLFDIKIGRTPPRKEQQWFSTNSTDVKWISIKDLGNSGIYIDSVSEYLTKEAVERFSIPIIPSNTVLLSFKLTVGRVAITTEEMLSNEAIAHFRIKPHSKFYSEFLYLFLKSFNFNSLGSTSSIAEAINSQMIKEIEMQIPNEEKLESFRIEIEPLFQKIKSNAQQIRTLTQLRDTLLPKLMSGEIRLNLDLQDEQMNKIMRAENKTDKHHVNPQK